MMMDCSRCCYFDRLLMLNPLRYLLSIRRKVPAVMHLGTPTNDEIYCDQTDDSGQPIMMRLTTNRIR